MEGPALRWLLLFLSLLLPFPATTLEDGIDIYSLHVDCKITSRYAHSTITSRVVNRANGSQEALFEVELPKSAFITNFSMTIDGVKYPGTINEKKAAQEQYDRAVSRGQSAGLVKATGRTMEKFEVSVNVAGGGKVTFELIYEELLKRKRGNYQLLLKVKPKQLVQQFQIDVRIFEPQGIRFLETSSTFLTNELSEALTKTVNETKAHVSFKPTIDQQRKSPGLEESLLDGDLMINYDVKRSTSAGDVQIINGYFVHYFAPAEMPTLPKNVVFVIDTSGSMSGRKIVQTREALLKILDDISSEDHLNLITFSSSISRWQDSMLKATESNINEAKHFVKSIRDHGATDINGALMTAVRLLSEAKDRGTLPERSVSMIIMLTDGQPTSGETNTERIQKNIKRIISERYALYCLGFGFDVDYTFLEKMALENGGLARRIYEDSDSALQLQGFYQEVANPILMRIQLVYPDNHISEVTEKNFRQLFDGAEIVVAGKIHDNDVNVFKAEIKAQAQTSDMVYTVEENIAEKEESLKQNQYVFGDFIERLWAYLTIQQLLEDIILAKGDEHKNLEQKALQLSLKYSFVTSLTSMVVTKPDDQEKPMVANKPMEEGEKEEDMQLSRVRHHPSRTAKTSFRMGSSGTSRHPGMHSKILSSSFLQNYHTSRHNSPPWIGYARVAYDAVDDYSNPVHDIALATETTPTQSASTIPAYTENYQPRSADYPDFIVRVPNQEDPICLNVIAEENHSINLIADPDMGMSVTGQMEQLRKSRRYFVSFKISYNNLGVNISVSKDTIAIENSGMVTIMEWTDKNPALIYGVHVSFVKRFLTIAADGQVTINISYVRSPKRFLRLYLTDVHNFSNKVTGLLGKFYFNTSFDANSAERQTAQETTLTVQGQNIKVTRNQKRNYKTNAHQDETISCWLANLTE